MESRSDVVGATCLTTALPITLALLLGAITSGAVRADEIQTTYLCVAPNGSKALQDRPCDGDAVSSAIPTHRQQPSLPDTVSMQMRIAVEKSKQANCSNMRRALAEGERNNRVVTDRQLGAFRAQNNATLRQRVAEDCTPYRR